MASDDLYELRNALALGNYSMVVNEAMQIKPSQYKKSDENAALMAERDYLLAKAQIGLRQYSLAISDLKNSKNKTLIALRCLAEYLRADQQGGGPDKETKAKMVEEVNELVESSLREYGEPCEANCMLAVTAATILVNEAAYEQALKLLETWNSALTAKSQGEKEIGSVGGLGALRLEIHALNVDIYLRMNRFDAAEKETKLMAKIDEDAHLTNFWSAWVARARVSDKSDEEALNKARHRFEDLMDQVEQTPLLLNAIALCHMSCGKWEEALKVLDSALNMRENDPDALINRMICKKQLSPLQENRASLDLLTSNTPWHPMALRLKQLDETFDVQAAKRKI